MKPIFVTGNKILLKTAKAKTRYQFHAQVVKLKFHLHKTLPNHFHPSPIIRSPSQCKWWMAMCQAMVQVVKRVTAAVAKLKWAWHQIPTEWVDCSNLHFPCARSISATPVCIIYVKLHWHCLTYIILLHTTTSKKIFQWTIPINLWVILLQRFLVKPN